jgi:hypothetical protein
LREHSDGKRCKCARRFLVWTASGSSGTKSYVGTFGTAREAKEHRNRVAAGLVETRKTSSAGPAVPTLKEASEKFLADAESGEARNRENYKASTLRGYQRELARVYDDLGAVRLDELSAKDVRALLRRLNASGLSGQSV